MTILQLASLILLAHLAILGKCELPAGKNVIEVTSKNWDQIVNDKQIVLIEFYSSLCGACRKFAPEYAKVGDYLKGAITVGRISLEDNRDKFEQLHVDTVPTIILHRPGQNTESWKASFTRTPTAIVDWVVGLLPVLNLNTNPSGLDGFLKPEYDVYPSRIALIYETVAPPRHIQPVTKSIIGTYRIKAEDWKAPHELPIFAMTPVLNFSSPLYDITPMAPLSFREYYSIDDPQFQVKLAQPATDSEPDDGSGFVFVTIAVILLLFSFFILCICVVKRPGKSKKQKNQPKRKPLEDLNSVIWSDEDIKHID